MVRQRHLMAVVPFVIGCAVLFIVLSASGMQAEASPEKEKQGHTEATKQEQGHSGGAAPEGDRCDRTRTIVRIGAGYLTNDLPGCPNKGGLLSAQLPDTGPRKISDPKYGLLMGEKGDDEVRGLGGSDELYGGEGNDLIYGEGDFDDLSGDEGDDVIYGGDGGDWLQGGKGEDVLYGGNGNDDLINDDLGGSGDGQRDKLYCGKGRDTYTADKMDYVDSSCEKGKLVDTGGPPLLLLAGAALCSALMMLRYVIRSA